MQSRFRFVFAAAAAVWFNAQGAAANDFQILPSFYELDTDMNVTVVAEQDPTEYDFSRYKWARGEVSVRGQCDAGYKIADARLNWPDGYVQVIESGREVMSIGANHGADWVRFQRSFEIEDGNPAYPAACNAHAEHQIAHYDKTPYEMYGLGFGVQADEGIEVGLVVHCDRIGFGSGPVHYSTEIPVTLGCSATGLNPPLPPDARVGDALRHPFQVTSARTRITPNSGTRQCPAELSIDIRVDAVGEGNAVFRIERIDGAKSAPIRIPVEKRQNGSVGRYSQAFMIGEERPPHPTPPPMEPEPGEQMMAAGGGGGPQIPDLPETSEVGEHEQTGAFRIVGTAPHAFESDWGNYRIDCEWPPIRSPYAAGDDGFRSGNDGGDPPAPPRLRVAEPGPPPLPEPRRVGRPVLVQREASPPKRKPAMAAGTSRDDGGDSSEDLRSQSSTVNSKTTKKERRTPKPVDGRPR